LPTSPLRVSQRVGSLLTIILLSCHQGQPRCSLSISTKRRAIQTFWDSTTFLGSSRVMPNHLGDQIPKSNKHNRGHRQRGWGALAWIRWLTQGSSNLLSRTRIKTWILGRERSSNFGSQGVFCFSEWPTTQVGRWGAIYSPHLERAVGESFHRTSLLGHWTSSVKLSRSWSGTKLVWTTRLVWCGPDKSDGRPLEASVEALEASPNRTCPIHRTSPIPLPDKSGGGLWKPVQALWKPTMDQISPVHRTSLIIVSRSR
jgi:hypothetical protein